MATLTPFTQNERIYRSSTETGVIADVVRLPPKGSLPLRYQKTIKGAELALVINEKRVLSACAQYGVGQVVSLIDYHEKPLQQVQSITTQAAGVDWEGWRDLRVRLVEQDTTISDVFFHAAILLSITKSTLQALYGIHQIGIIHCDIKTDNLCLPYTGKDAATGGVIRPQFNDITLIDFGHAHWRGNPIGRHNRCWLGKCDDSYRYQSKHLTGIIDQWLIDNHTRKDITYNNQALNQIDYSCDLYSFGFALQDLCSRMQDLSDLMLVKPWSLMWTDYQDIIQQLLNYDNGIPAHQTDLPHLEWIAKLNELQDKVEGYLGYATQDISLSLLSQSTPTPTLPEQKQRQTKLLSAKHSQLSADEQMWQTACQSDTAKAYQAYIDMFTKGEFVTQAKKKLSSLNGKNAAANENLDPISDNFGALKEPESRHDAELNKKFKSAKRNTLKYWAAVIAIVLIGGIFILTQNHDDTPELVVEELQEDLLVEDASPEYIDFYNTMADKGNNVAMRKLGILYYHGRGVDRDLTKAYQWFSRSADAGNAAAMRNKAYMLLGGEGVEKDTELGQKWMIQAADKGDDVAKDWVSKNINGSQLTGQQSIPADTLEDTSGFGNSEQAAPKYYKAGFDCRKAKLKQDILICSDATLARMDKELLNYYQKAKTVSQDSVEFNANAKQSLHWRLKNCHTDRQCLIEWYDARKKYYSEIISS